MREMARTYTPEELAGIAEQSAQELGLEVIRWWQNESDPRELYIEATLKPKNIVVLLVTILPG